MVQQALRANDTYQLRTAVKQYKFSAFAATLLLAYLHSCGAAQQEAEFKKETAHFKGLGCMSQRQPNFPRPQPKPRGTLSFLFTMADKTCTIRTRKFITNRLLARKQFVSSGPYLPEGQRIMVLGASCQPCAAEPQRVLRRAPGTDPFCPCRADH